MLAIDLFEDLASRHELRTRLFCPLQRCLDPRSVRAMGLLDRLERTRQALCIGWALGQLGGADWFDRLVDFQGSPLTAPKTSEIDPIYWPSAMAEVPYSPDMQPDLHMKSLHGCRLVTALLMWLVNPVHWPSEH